MSYRCLLAAVIPLIFASHVLAEDAAYTPKMGPFAVTTVDAEWKATESKLGPRTIPVRMYFPEKIGESEKPLPAIVFSHGLGGSRAGYEYWSAYWASYGYVVVNPTHVGSDTEVLKTQGLEGLKSAMSADNVVKRISDVHFVIAELEKLNAGQEEGEQYKSLVGKIDVKHMGMAGHSFGAQTTLSIAGEVFNVAGRKKSVTEPDVVAAIAMSPAPAVMTGQDEAFGSIKMPVFHLTGTEDVPPGGISDVKPEERRVPFDHSNAPGTLLVIFNGGNHMTFAPTKTGQVIGARLRQAAADDPAFHDLIRESTLAFWDAHLKENAGAEKWLVDEFAKALGDKGTFEKK